MKTSYFDLRELIPPEVYHERGEAAWELLDDRALKTLDQLRANFGPIVVNNWHVGGPFKESGLRVTTTDTGAKWSQHKFGRAFDCKPQQITPAEMYRQILDDPGLFPFITTLENIASTPTWVHFDVRNNPTPGIRIVNP